MGSAAATALAFVAGRLHPALGILGVFLVFNPAFLALSELGDAFVGPAMAREAGHSYVLQVQVANVMVVLGYLLGIILWRWSRHHGATGQRARPVRRVD